MTPKELKEILEYAPKDPGPMAPGLVGNVTPLGYFFCAECVCRAMRRMGYGLFKGFVPVWSDCMHSDEPCDCCGKIAERTQ